MTDTEFLALLERAGPEALLAFGLIVADQIWSEATGESCRIPLSDKQLAFIESILVADGAARATAQRSRLPSWLTSRWGDDGDTGPVRGGWGG